MNGSVHKTTVKGAAAIAQPAVPSRLRRADPGDSAPLGERSVPKGTLSGHCAAGISSGEIMSCF